MSAVLPMPGLAPRRAMLLGMRGWLGVTIALAVVAVIVPIANLLVPDGSVFHLSDYAVQLVAKIMCYAMAALAMDLIWGYTGILSLGHGVFFALGGYAMGMYLMRQIGSDGQYRLPMPDFMVFLNWKQYPWHWALSNSFVAQMLFVVLGGVGQLAGTVYAALGLGLLNKLLEGWQGAVLAKIMVLVFIVVFIQKRPQGIFAMKGRSAEA